VDRSSDGGILVGCFFQHDLHVRNLLRMFFRLGLDPVETVGGTTRRGGSRMAPSFFHDTCRGHISYPYGRGLSRCGRGHLYVLQTEIYFRSDVSFRLCRPHRSMALVASGSCGFNPRDRFLLLFVELQKLEYSLEFHRGTEIPCFIDKYNKNYIFTYCTVEFEEKFYWIFCFYCNDLFDVFRVYTTYA
jgi:hypothetical protein